MKRILALAFLATILLIPCLAVPASAAAENQKQILPTSPLYLLVKAKESIQQWFTFDQSSKAELTEQFTEQRIKEMTYATHIGDNEALNLSLKRYQTQKKQSLGYVLGTSDARLAEKIDEKTLEQQKIMTQLQLEIEGSQGVQQQIVEVQKEVAEDTNNVVSTVLGEDAAAETDNKTRYIWLDPNADASGNLPPLPEAIDKWEYAPGTEGRDDAGRVVEYTMAPGTEGGGVSGQTVQIQWAPGTQGGGESGVVYEGGPKVVITGEGSENNAGGNSNYIEAQPLIDVKESE